MLLTALHLALPESISQLVTREVPVHAPATSAAEGRGIDGAGEEAGPQRVIPLNATISTIRDNQPLTDKPFPACFGAEQRAIACISLNLARHATRLATPDLQPPLSFAAALNLQ